jgi:glutamate/tyrosine decarboxylase-like PLP-dependent enzyme
VEFALSGRFEPEQKLCSKALGNSLLLSSLLPLFFTLKHLGLETIEALLSDSIAKVHRFHDYLRCQPDFSLFLCPTLDILCFQHIPSPNLTIDQKNQITQHIYKELYQKGRHILSLITVQKEKYFRINPINPLTKMTHLTALVDEIRNHAKGALS